MRQRHLARSGRWSISHGRCSGPRCHDVGREQPRPSRSGQPCAACLTRCRPLTRGRLGIIDIYHHLEEVVEISPDVAVLRHGDAGVLRAADGRGGKEELVTALVGSPDPGGSRRPSPAPARRGPCVNGRTGYPTLVVSSVAAVSPTRCCVKRHRRRARRGAGLAARHCEGGATTLGPGSWPGPPRGAARDAAEATRRLRRMGPGCWGRHR